jgi:DNA-nicking Smr family endonuclease
LVKELGKGITNLRTLSADVTKTFETNMESQLQLEDLRKAQRELNDAFSFRRSINVDDEVAFNEISTTPTETTTSTEATTATEGAPTRKLKRKRVKKKKLEPEMDFEYNVPDLEMPALDDTLIREEEERAMRQEEERLRSERMERLRSGTQPSPTEQEMFGLPSVQSPEEQERFAQQLSGNWNEMVLANEDKLSPLSKIMERLAILEEEKKAADARLEEEFRLRTGVEEKYYREKRAILEEAAAEVQAEAYVSLNENNKTV